MNKLTLILGVLLLVLSGLTAWYFTRPHDPNTTFLNKDQQFAVEDISQVHKVFIADRSGNQPITLTQNGDHWLVNGQYRARASAIDLVLEVLERIKVRNTPTKAMEELIVKSLASNGIKVEAYDQNNQLLTAFYLGTTTNDVTGTFAIKEGANQPYVTHMPPWVGSIRGRFEKHQFEAWRDKAIFRFDPARIEQISVNYPKQQSKSFILEKTGKDYQVTPYHKETTASPLEVNQSLADAYVENFREIYSEAYLNDYQYQPQVKAMVPFCEISIQLKDGTQKSAQFFPRMDFDEEKQTFHLPEEGTFFYYWVATSDGDFFQAQEPLIKAMFRDYPYFFTQGEG